MQTFQLFLEATRGPPCEKMQHYDPTSLVFRPFASNLCDLQQVFVCVYKIFPEVSDI